jgi:hypothetical protein
MPSLPFSIDNAAVQDISAAMAAPGFANQAKPNDHTCSRLAARYKYWTVLPESTSPFHWGITIVALIRSVPFWSEALVNALVACSRS